jgi:hypothetical protein
MATFEGALNEGDNIVIGAGPTTTYALTNQTIDDVAESVDTQAKTLRLHNLGDDPTTTQDDSYNYAAPNSSYSVEGATAGLAQFDAALSNGDDIRYDRNGGEQSFALTTRAPDRIAGSVTETYDVTSQTITLAQGGFRFPINYGGSPAPTFTVDGNPASQAQFDQALSPGDYISYQPGDPATSTHQTLDLRNYELFGTIDDIQTANGTYDVDTDGLDNVIYDNFSYRTVPPKFPTKPIRYFVSSNGGVSESEVTLAQWEVTLANLNNQQNPYGHIHLTVTSLAIEHHLTLP